MIMNTQQNWHIKARNYYFSYLFEIKKIIFVFLFHFSLDILWGWWNTYMDPVSTPPIFFRFKLVRCMLVWVELLNNYPFTAVKSNWIEVILMIKKIYCSQSRDHSNDAKIYFVSFLKTLWNVIKKLCFS